MSDSTIKLLDKEQMKKLYLEQYQTLSEALQETVSMLKALGVDVELAEILGIPKQTVHTSPRPRSRSMTALVREACESFPSSFTRSDVISYIENNHPDQKEKIKAGSISAMLSAMAANGGLKLVEGGSGGVLGVYEVPVKG